MHRGYIKLWRKLKEWEWYRNSETLHLFLHLMLNANYKDTRFMGYEIKRGDIVCGRKQLCADTGISEQSIRSCLERLKSTSEITSKSTNKFSIITLCNYETYQSDILEINQQNRQQLTSDQPATNQQLTTSKEGKKEKKAIKKRIIQEFTPPSFEEFEKYCQENGFKNIAARAFKGYSEGDWHDAQGNKIHSWKQKLQNGWFQDRNKDTVLINKPPDRPTHDDIQAALRREQEALS